jgi:hypothetical protein
VVMNETTEQTKARWEKAFQPLVGRKITSVRWMMKEEQKEAGWYSSPIILQLDDGTLLYPQSDDEGNDGGALAVQAGSKTKGAPTVAPVIR